MSFSVKKKRDYTEKKQKQTTKIVWWWYNDLKARNVARRLLSRERERERG